MAARSNALYSALTGRTEPVAGGLPSQRPQTLPSQTQTACPSRSSTCGARSSSEAGSRVVHRSAGSWLRSMWSSQEMSRSVMGSSVELRERRSGQMPPGIGREVVPMGPWHTLANDPATTADEMRDDRLARPAAPVAVAAVHGQAVVDGDVTGLHLERNLLATHGGALGRREQAADVVLQLANQDLKAAHEAPVVTGVDHMKTPALRGRVVERQ